VGLKKENPDLVDSFDIEITTPSIVDIESVEEAEDDELLDAFDVT